MSDTELVKNAIYRLRCGDESQRVKPGYTFYTDFTGRYSAIGMIVKQTTGCSDSDIVHNVSQVFSTALEEIVQAFDDMHFTWNEIANFLDETYLNDEIVDPD